MSSLTNDMVQTQLEKALVIIADAKNTETDLFSLAKIDVLYSTLNLIKMVAQSSNGITSLRGMGAEKAYFLSMAIVAEGTLKTRFLSYNYKSLMEGLNIVYPR